MNIQEFRQQYPQYNGKTDLEIADAVKAKVAPGMQKEDFYKRFGLTQEGPTHRAVTPPRNLQADMMGASTANRIGTGINDMLQGAAQMATHAMPDSVLNAGNKASQYLNDLPVVGPVTKAMGITPITADQQDKRLALREQNIQGDRANAGEDGIDWSRMAGNVVGAAPLAYAMPGAATIPGAALAGAAGGAGTAAMQPVTDTYKPYWDQKNDQLAMGAATGAVMGPAGTLLGRAINPTVNADVQALMNRGVTPTPGQIMGGGFARTEQKLTSIPFLGDMIKNAQRRGIEQFNRAAAEDVLAPIGGQAPNLTGRALIDAVDTRLSDAYQAILPNLRFRADPRFLAQVNQLRQMTAGLPEQQARRFEQIINDQLTSKIGVNGRLSPFQTIDGQTFKGIESELSRMSRGYQGDASFDNRQLGSAVRQLQALMRQSLERTNPQHAPQLQAVNQAFARFVRLQDAGVRAGDDQIFTPAQLQAAVKKSDTSTRKGAYARGDALMQDLADAGRNVLGSKYPDSGTAGRAMIGYLASLGLGGSAGAATGAPLVGAGVGAAAALPYTQLGGRLAAGILTRRPQFAPEIEAGLLGLAPAAQAGAILGFGQ